jgi:hypothetical protein
MSVTTGAAESRDPLTAAAAHEAEGKGMAARRLIDDANSHPALPVGYKRHVGPTPNFITPNTSSIIDGRQYTGHALDEMRNQGIMPSVIENTIKNGVVKPGNIPTREVRYDMVNNVSVVLEKDSGLVVTASLGRLGGM